MRARFFRGFSITVVLASTLIGGTTIATSASAAPGAETAVAVAGEPLTTFVRSVTFPELKSGCLPGTASKLLPDHRRQLVTTIPCSSQAVMPPAITLPAGFESQSGDAFVAKVSALSGASSTEAANAIATAAKVPVSELSKMTVSSLARSMLLAHASVTDVTGDSDTAEKTSVCAKNSAGQTGCASIEGALKEGLFWGAVGAFVGFEVGGGIGAVVGAVIGFIIGLL
jgi:hypothetical protein